MATNPKLPDHKAGLAIDPCLVPFLIQNLLDTDFPDLTNEYGCWYMYNYVLITTGGMSKSTSLENMVLNLRVSKALEQSRTVLIGFQ